MVLYKCECCNFVTILKSNYTRHLKTKKHLTNIQNSLSAMVMNTNEHKMNTNEHKMNTNEHKMNTNFNCQFCGESFKTNPSKRRHELHYCKHRLDNMSYKELFLESKKEKKDLKNQIEILLTKVGDTTINNTQNIQLNSYGKESLEHITDAMKSQLLNIPYGMIPKMIEQVHFNNDKPENKNILLPNKKDNKLKVYKNNKWEYRDKDEILKDLIGGKYFILDTFYDSVVENLNKSSKHNYEKFLSNFDENNKELHEQLKKECEIILLNNR
jgi:hypothetical protein